MKQYSEYAYISPGYIYLNNTEETTNYRAESAVPPFDVSYRKHKQNIHETDTAIRIVPVNEVNRKQLCFYNPTSNNGIVFDHEGGSIYFVYWHVNVINTLERRVQFRLVQRKPSGALRTENIEFTIRSIHTTAKVVLPDEGVYINEQLFNQLEFETNQQRR
jgi:hypothetical protein